MLACTLTADVCIFVDQWDVAVALPEVRGTFGGPAGDMRSVMTFDVLALAGVVGPSGAQRGRRAPRLSSPSTESGTPWAH